MKNNRRNFYRILQVQPDAPLDIIKNNYRTLLHKLRLHPDLGGDSDTASAINLAYATLKNSVKRAAYDRKLLNQYKIEVLSKGHLSHSKSKSQKPKNNPSAYDNNRNYYRMLHIQPDAPLAIIFSNYNMLLNKQGAPVELIKEAYAVLSVPQYRKQYDQLLKQGKHRATILANKEKFKSNTEGTQGKSDSKIKVKKYSQCNSSMPYRPLITHYCDFCKTPQNVSSIEHVDDLCVECFSPLHSSKEYLFTPRRFFSRIEFATVIDFYPFWPSNKIVATLSDLSPTGLCFVTKQPLNKEQIIKIETNQLNAIGRVKHKKMMGVYNRIGIEFIKIQFNSHKGTFVSVSV